LVLISQKLVQIPKLRGK